MTEEGVSATAAARVLALVQAPHCRRKQRRDAGTTQAAAAASAQASRFYPLFGIAANVALIFSGQAVKHFSDVRAHLPPGVDGWGYSLRGLMSMVVAFGLAICALRRYLEVTTVKKLAARDPGAAVRSRHLAACVYARRLGAPLPPQLALASPGLRAPLTR